MTTKDASERRCNAALYVRDNILRYSCS